MTQVSWGMSLTGWLIRHLRDIKLRSNLWRFTQMTVYSHYCCYLKNRNQKYQSKMILKSLKLRNIRSYENQEINFPTGSTLLAGDIGTGK